MTYSQIITACIAILAIVSGTWIPLHIARRNRFNTAADAFRSAFDETIHALETIPFCDRDIINKTFRRHEAAMIKFRSDLRGRELASFNKDWKGYEEYCLSRVDVPMPFLLGVEVSDINGPDDSKAIDARHRNCGLIHIKRLLSYAEK
jgi:hypothetical protein